MKDKTSELIKARIVRNNLTDMIDLEFRDGNYKVKHLNDEQYNMFCRLHSHIEHLMDEHKKPAKHIHNMIEYGIAAILLDGITKQLSGPTKVLVIDLNAIKTDSNPEPY